MNLKQLLLTVTVWIGLFTVLTSVSAQTWTLTGALSNNWGSVTASADGTKLVATSGNGIYTSTNSGTTWIQTDALLTNISSIASSADGNKLVAAGFSAAKSSIFTSADSGVTWTKTSAPFTNWVSVASSANGSNLVAVGYSITGIPTKGFAFTSTNAGTTWKSSNIPSLPWFSVASSADGNKLVAAASSGGTILLYVSTNFGATWIPTTLPTASWSCVASSADGTKLIAAAQGGFSRICTSINSGMTWITNNLPKYSWQSVASSANGKQLVAVSGGFSNYFNGPILVFVPLPGPIYSSSDSGTTWTSNNAPNLQWQSVALSADGTKQYAVEMTGGQIYSSQTIPSPQLNIVSSTNNFAFSWLVPSTNFVLQQNLDLSTTNWMTLTNTPALNLTNLQDEVTLSPSNSTGFFRLLAQ